MAKGKRREKALAAKRARKEARKEASGRSKYATKRKIGRWHPDMTDDGGK